MAIEQNDPCARAIQLREIRDKLITGQSLVEFEQESGNGVRRRARYTTADLGRLDREILAAENACAISKGGRPRRFAIVPR
ncbi:hypothetical protein SAMN05892877_13239 [Rhizobium subbaraonis]|uniref:GpW protein n=1 Tax=Rhizobium subbaraonis TaxID=908946 RepID=A0A285V0X4_9HYPH|nr:hypothetical protein [Rhizobium subbaraonis]SOC47710.1 hypothetical protein SAMN05892877_13239 [Rhizobium subbaraonis]